ncbi:2S seed storage albumin protein-like [Vicia villosa]|uniref:2S seed storage albumin protein-like n=1 Tax=Vicia villosa TaxID=3911 RepID=UPI00273AD940|nr:2S seed storage albumin protein-like [Vicia villosa]
MARHNILLIASLLALALSFAHTNASREEEMKERCSKKIESLNLKPCENHLMRMIQKDEDEDKNVLKMKGINHIRRGDNPKEKCCDQLSEVHMLDCRCQALQEIMDNLNDRLPKKEMEDAEKKVKMLPMSCGIAPPLGCDLNLDN